MSSASVPRAAVVVEDRYSEIFALTFARPAVVADALAELQIAFPAVPIVFCQTRKLAQEYTYRYLAAAHTWLADNGNAMAAPAEREPSSSDLRDWARSVGLNVSPRGRLPRTVVQAWHDAHRE